MTQVLKVQFGCGLCTPNDWLNFDSTPTLLIAQLPMARQLAGLAIRLGLAPPGTTQHLQLTNLRLTRARYGDISRGLPLRSGSVQQLYASHVIEHLPLTATRQALRECARMLATNGVFRLVVPDLRYQIECYRSNVERGGDSQAAIRFCLESGLGSVSWGPLWSRMRGDRHHLMHDEASLRSLLLEAGFPHVRRAHFVDSALDFAAVEDSERWREPDNIGLECHL